MPSTRPASQPEPALPETRPSGSYWDAVYQRGASHVSWFQAEPQASVDLIRAHATPHTPIIDAGAGAGSPTGQLAVAGFTDLTAVDISAAARHNTHFLCRVGSQGGRTAKQSTRYDRRPGPGDRSGCRKTAGYGVLACPRT